MSLLKDLTGQRFGKLIVLNRADNNKYNQTMWNCICDCGNQTVIRGYSLTTGNTTSCGCKIKETLSKRNKELGKIKRIKEIGNRYGKLIVLDLDLSRTNSSQNAWWECECDCGNTTSVSGVDLRRGHTISCGCAKSKGELKIISLLQENLLTYSYQYSFDDLIGITNKLKFDFAIFKEWEILSHLIEFDGVQHFNPCVYFGGQETFQRTKELDYLKNEYCKQNNIPLIRIKYTLLDTLKISHLLLKEGSELIDCRE